MLDFKSTIAAISTPLGTGGIGIVRLSGEYATSIAKKIIYKGNLKNDDFFVSHTIKLGKFIDPASDQIIDEGLILYMKAPHSYTGEDIVEFQCHGGIITVSRILQALLKSGAVLAEKGEFTKRAFLNGKIDLTKAEAVIDIINAKTDVSLNTAIKQYEGSLLNKITKLRETLIGIMAHLEAYVDFPEDDIDELTRKNIIRNCENIKEELIALLKTFESGRVLREGICAAIVGETNVGKSSFLNEMLNKNKAIVTEYAGTTRDVIEDYINIQGILIKILDTAGIRESEDFVERLGIEKSKKAIKEADLIFFILDISKEISQQERDIAALVKDKKCIVLLNKNDKEMVINLDELKNIIGNPTIIKTSMVDGTGITEVKSTIANMFIKGDILTNNNEIISNIRHRDAVERASVSLEKFISELNNGIVEDVASQHLKRALRELGTIIGEVYTEDILDEIFSKFCIGK